jgi:hypothetical protein
MRKPIVRSMMLLCLALPGSAHAALIHFSIDGVVTNIDNPFALPDPFGLEVGDTVTATAIYDDSALTGIAVEGIHFGSGSGNSTTHVIGDVTFDETADLRFDHVADPGPKLFFANGAFLSWSFFGLTDSFVYNVPGFNSFVAQATGQPSSGVTVAGEWLVESARFTPVAVPEPGTLLLLSAGLVARALSRRGGRPLRLVREPRCPRFSRREVHRHL